MEVQPPCVSLKLAIVWSLQEIKFGQGLWKKDTYQINQECKAMKAEDSLRQEQFKSWGGEKYSQLRLP